MDAFDLLKHKVTKKGLSVTDNWTQSVNSLLQFSSLLNDPKTKRDLPLGETYIYTTIVKRKYKENSNRIFILIEISLY